MGMGAVGIQFTAARIISSSHYLIVLNCKSAGIFSYAQNLSVLVFVLNVEELLKGKYGQYGWHTMGSVLCCGSPWDWRCDPPGGTQVR